MNKRILMSVAAAATVATIFTGCGTDSLSSSSSSGFAAKGTLQGTTITIGTGTGVTDNNGYYTVTNPTGTTITTGTDGIDAVTGVAPTRSLSSDTTLVDADGNVIINAITDAAVKSGESDLNATMNTIAVKMGYTLADVLKPITNSAADAAIENASRLLFSQITSFVNDGNATGAFTAISNAQDGNFTSVLTALNAVTGDINTTANPLTQVVASLSSQPSAFATATENFDANMTSAITNATTAIQNTIVLDQNVSTATITDAIGDISVLDTNGTVSITKSNDSNESGELLISLSNTATSGNDANAAYTLRLNNLLVTKDANGYITNLSEAPNSNTSLEITANSNMSKALNLSGSDVNATMLLSTYALITAATGSTSGTGMDINTTAFTNYVTSVVGTGSDTATNGNYTSGMTASGTFALDVLLNVNDNNVTTSEQVYFGETGNMKVNGTTHVGYKVIDANLTK